MSTQKMHIDTYERNWMIVSAILLVLFATAVSVAAFGLGIQVPAPEQRVDPRTVATDPNSPWSNPGLREIAPGKYDAYVLARAVPNWEYLPKEMVSVNEPPINTDWHWVASPEYIPPNFVPPSVAHKIFPIVSDLKIRKSIQYEK